MTTAMEIVRRAIGNDAATLESELEKADAKIEQLREALTAAQWGFNHVRCPLCAGWMMGPYGETDMKHTPDCIIALALKD